MKKYDILFSFLKLLVTTAVIGFGIHSIKEYENTQDVKIEVVGVPKVETGELENSLSKQNGVDLCYDGSTNYLSTLSLPKHKERKGTTETTLDLLREIASKTTFRDENMKSEKRLTIQKLRDQ